MKAQYCKLSTEKLQGNSHVRPGSRTKLCLMFLLARKHEYEQNQVSILASKLDFKPGCCLLAEAKSILPALQSALILSQYFTMQFPDVSSLVDSEETQCDPINLRETRTERESIALLLPSWFASCRRGILRWAVADLGFCGGFERKDFSGGLGDKEGLKL
ncbi:hypothetical protein Peur_031062 [Populus x canadensis]